MAALRQFEALRRLAGEMSQAANGDSAAASVIDAMNARATSRQLAALGVIYGRVSESGKETVENSMKLSLEGHQQAVERLEDSGVSDPAVEKPQLPDTVPEKVKERISDRDTGEAEPPGKAPDRDRKNGPGPDTGGKNNGQH